MNNKSAELSSSSAIRIAALGFAVSMLLTIPLWLGQRDFPVLPVSHLLNGCSPVITTFSSLLLFISLVALCLRPFSFLGYTVVIAAFILFLFYQNRIQPWAYFFVLLIAARLFQKNKTENTRVADLMRWIIIAVYFWSGIHKFNSHFSSAIFIPALEKIFGVGIPNAHGLFYWSAYLLPCAELYIASGLFFPHLRRTAIVTAFLLHGFIALYLSPAGIDTDYSVLPWNICMGWLSYVLFWKNDLPVQLPFRAGYNKIYRSLIWSLVVCLPVLNLFGWFDDYPAFSVYSGNERELLIAVPDHAVPLLNDRFKNDFVAMPPGVHGGKLISANKWAMRTLHVVVNPETRIFYQLADSFRKNNLPQHEEVFLLMPVDPKDDQMVSFR